MYFCSECPPTSNCILLRLAERRRGGDYRCSECGRFYDQAAIRRLKRFYAELSALDAGHKKRAREIRYAKER